MVARLIACGLPAHEEAATPSSLSIVKAVKQHQVAENSI